MWLNATGSLTVQRNTMGVNTFSASNTTQEPTGDNGQVMLNNNDDSANGKIRTWYPSTAALDLSCTATIMAVAPTKNSDRFEWFLEKATEVGLDGVVPIECANSERRVFNPARATKVLASAMKQSLKAYLPELAPLTSVRELIERPFDGVKLIAHCRPEDFGSRRIPITEALPPHKDALILIGPEGDFTAEEVGLAVENGFIPISLGESRLRTETAALVAVTAAYLANSLR